jgi:hypothetical protein
MPTVGESRGRPYAKPVYLVEVALGNSGPTLYLSDRNITVGTNRYEDYLRDLSGIAEGLERSASGWLNADVTLSFKNDRYLSYEYLIEMGETYPFEGAECVIKEVYLDDPSAGSSHGGPVELFRGVLDEPEHIDLLFFRCALSGMDRRADRQW